jgi:TolB-like protein/DNA-binding winged helix-turn-helix (wHTH) protein/Tfp pilus assembly protein PilF
MQTRHLPVSEEHLEGSGIAARSGTMLGIVRFACYEVDLASGQLRKGGVRIKLRDQPFQVLASLLERPGEVVSREDLQHRLWHDEVFVDFENNLNTAVARLREALCDSAEHPRYVETLPKRGYRFIGEVERDTPAAGVQARSQAGLLRLSWSWAAAAALVLIAVTGYLLWRSQRVHPGGRQRAMMAVLPLENLSGDPEQEFLAASLTEEIIAELGRLNPKRLGVIARTSVAQYRGTKKTVAQIGKELGVDYVVEGGAQMVDHRIRVVVQLIRVSDQTHVWADAYDRNLEDVLAVERSVAQQTARALSVELLPEAERRLATNVPVSPEAQEAYLRGRFLLSRRLTNSLLEARGYFEKTIALEPNFPAGYSALGVTYILLPQYHAVPRAETVPKAKAAALKALELDPSLAEARTVLAEIHAEFEWDFANGEKEFRRALQDNPNYALAHQWYAAYLWAMGRFDEGIVEMQRTVELSPASLGTAVDLGRAYYFARQYDRAIQQYQKVIAVDPTFSSAHGLLGLALLEKKDYARGIAEIENGIALVPNAQSIWLAYAYARAGRTADAKQELARCLQRWNQKHTGAICMSLGYAGLADKDQAFAWLNTELTEHSGTIYMLKAFPYWDSLRSDPRYAELLRRAGLPQ